ncbi:MAG: NUDIX hydrolase [Chloroflexi bacterium]|nr:NUDIX hydrolase [Chloroflexota bacterium]MDA1240967.1 NUDIX hydrolase [Chloroflexota bacterium]MQC48261.1 NUDIX hydrolase [Chloroflexota bacterium]
MTSDPVEAIPALVRSEPLAEHRYLRITRDTIRFPDGHEADRAVVWHPGAVALVVEDGDGRWLLVRQYRHPTGGNLLEVPAGTMEPGEPPEVTAAREVREETGYAAGTLVHLGGLWMLPGYCSEYMHFYLATDLRPDPLPQDHDEYITEPVRLSLDEVEAAIDAGVIQDAKTVVAVGLLRRYRARSAG